MSGAAGDPGEGLVIMNACDESEENVLLPPQGAYKQSTSQGTARQGLAARANSLPREVLEEPANLEATANKDGNNTAAPGSTLDEARFTAGIVKFYEAVLNEPIPGNMLGLVEEIAKRERGA